MNNLLKRNRNKSPNNKSRSPNYKNRSKLYLRHLTTGKTK